MNHAKNKFCSGILHLYSENTTVIRTVSCSFDIIGKHIQRTLLNQRVANAVGQRINDGLDKVTITGNTIVQLSSLREP